jgi:hypothetical protein
VHLIDLVLAHVLVAVRAHVLEELGVVGGEPRHDLVVGTGDEDLVRLGEAHDPLGHVDAVADDVAVPVDVADDAHRSQVDPEAQPQAVLGRLDHPAAEAVGGEERILGVAQEAERGAVAGIEDDRSAAGVCSSAVARISPNAAFISTCRETDSSEYCTISAKTTVQMRFPEPR